MGLGINACTTAEPRPTEVGTALGRLQCVASNLSDESRFLTERISDVLSVPMPATSAETKEGASTCGLAEIINGIARSLEATYDSLYSARQRVEL